MSLFLRHKDGATHQLTGARFKKLKKQLSGPEAQNAVVALMEAGYVGFLSTHPDHAAYDGDVDITELAAKYLE